MLGEAQRAPHETPGMRIRRSYARATVDAPAFAAAFYRRLFQRAPELRPLFSRSLKAQEDGLVHALDAIVALGDQPAALRAALGALGTRHRDYAVTAAHCGVFADAILETLDIHCGPEFDDEDRRAWRALLEEVWDAMELPVA